MNTLAVIPARYGSTRLHAKALADILGKPMIQWVWQAVRETPGIDRAIVATDDERIKKVVESFGGEAMMTPSACGSGTARVLEVARCINARLYLNVQGDEPLITRNDLELLIREMEENPQAEVGTLYAPITYEAAQDPNLVKVVLTHDNHALYFSRSLIPYPRDGAGSGYFGHLGIYAYRPSFLARFNDLPASSLERAEKLEQLRFLQAGISIRCARAERMTIGVDTARDLEKVCAVIAGRGAKRHGLEKIKLIITDVDGVLTDGRLYYDGGGECMKSFCARDGLGILRAQKAGLKLAILSGRDSSALRARIRDTGIALFRTGTLAKQCACKELIREAGCEPDQVIYIGDDLPDKEAFASCAFTAAPADAEESTKMSACMVTKAKGGEGVLREVVDAVLEAQSRC